MNTRMKSTGFIVVALFVVLAALHWSGGDQIVLRRLGPLINSLVNGQVRSSGDLIRASTSDSVEGSTSPRTKVLLIGLDGAEWNIIRPLVRQGKLPNLARLMREGVSGTLYSSKPLLSPLIWTTIATGKKPIKHNITDFLVVHKESGEEIPVTSNLRAVKALWNIISEHKKKVGVVGWLVTWPAEPVNGIIISDRLTYLDYDPQKASALLTKQVTYPETLMNTLKPFVTDVDSIPFDRIRRFCRVGQKEYEESMKNKTDPLFAAASVVAASETYRNMAVHFLKEHSTDFFAVYFKGIDSFGHLFAWGSDTTFRLSDRTRVQKYGRAIQDFYRYQDEILGDLLGLIDDSTTVIIVSDHGFKIGANQPLERSEIGRGRASEWHTEEGIVVIFGNAMKRGTTLKGARTVDIAPTVLYLLGLPVATDMDGRVLASAFLSEHLKNNPIQNVETFEGARTSSSVRRVIASKEDVAIKRQLQSLGYLNPETPNSNNNQGILWMEEGEYRRAVDAFKKAIVLRPDVPAFYDNLGTAYNALGRHREAIEQHQTAIRLNPKLPKLYNNLGMAYFEAGEDERARNAYETALALQPNFADALSNLGNVYYSQGAFEKAEDLLMQSLKIDPGLARSHYNLGVMYGHRGFPERAVVEFRKVLEIAPNFPQRANVNNGLGVAYFELKMFDGALAEFRKVLQLDPKFPGVHSRMGIVYVSSGDRKNGRKEFQKELEMDPGNTMVRRALQELEKAEKRE